MLALGPPWPRARMAASRLFRLDLGYSAFRPGEVDHVGQPSFEQLQQGHAGDAARSLGRLEIPAELILEHAVDALDFLLFAQLDAVAGELGLPRLAMLAGREVALLDRTLLRIA